MNSIIDEDAALIARSTAVNWDVLQNKTVLIAGANGYVPQFFVHSLLKRNDLYNSDIKVIAICRDIKKAKKRFGNYTTRSDFQLIFQDVGKPVNIDKKIDYIIHAASPAGIKVTMDNPLAVFNANVSGGENLLNLAMHNSARFLYLSSVDVYGHIPEIRRYEECDMGTIDHLSSRNIYAASKRAAEALCMCYFHQGVDCIIVRPSQIIGSGISMDDERLHINMISQAIKSGKIILKGDGTPKRSFIYVTDAVTGMLTAMTRGTAGEVYNVCNEQAEATVRELAETVASIDKDKNVNIEYNMESRKKDPAVTHVVSQVCISSSKLQQLGWKPNVSLINSCTKMMCYYKAVYEQEKSSVM